MQPIVSRLFACETCQSRRALRNSKICRQPGLDGRACASFLGIRFSCDFSYRKIALAKRIFNMLDSTVRNLLIYDDQELNDVQIINIAFTAPRLSATERVAGFPAFVTFRGLALYREKIV